MVENRKVKKFLDMTKFGPMDGGKATVIADWKMSYIFTLFTNYLAPFIKNKYKLYFRESFMAGQGDGGRGARGREGDKVR